jgi:hypothetical protein
MIDRCFFYDCVRLRVFGSLSRRNMPKLRRLGEYFKSSHLSLYIYLAFVIAFIECN